MNIALYTDEKGMASIMSYLFKQIPGTIHSRYELNGHPELNCTHVILGVNSLEDADWEILKAAICLGKKTYLMIRGPISLAQARKARDIGVKEILIDPISQLVRHVANSPEQLFSLLTYPELHEPADGFTDIIDIGSNTYFNPNQYWVKYGNTKNELSEKEAALLLFFLEHEGRVITKYAIAEKLWGGFIQPDGISKAIARMKNKLGPARKLISSRHLGGFLYSKNTTLNTTIEE